MNALWGKRRVPPLGGKTNLFDLKHMLELDTLELIATSDDDLPVEDANFVVEDRGDTVVIPIQRIGHIGIWGMTVALAIVVTPLCYFVATALRFPASGPPLVLMIVWFLAVFGPVGFYYCLPFGAWNPDHLLLFERKTETFSFQGGLHRWHRTQIRYLVAITGAGKQSKRIETELQICIGESPPFQKHLLLHSTHRDPDRAFGKILRDFSSAMQVPAYLAKISTDGAYEVRLINDEQKAAHH